MTWAPKYTITHALLSTIREIGEAMGNIKSDIKSFRLSGQTLATLEVDARALSSYASTSIEGNPLPLTDVRRLLKTARENIRDTEREVLNYNAALTQLYAGVKAGTFELNVKALEKIQKQVTLGLMDNPAHCGHLRNDPVVIRNARKPDELVFIPPDAKDVRRLTQELCAFINTNRGQVDPILLGGLFHRQCVIIHLFMDGNGRTTRLATTAIMGQARLDLFDIFSFENYYNQNITRYFKSVGMEGDYYELESNIDFTQWLEYFAGGILDELRRVQKSLQVSSAAVQPRLEPYHREVLAYIEAHGSITQREYGEFSRRSLAARKLDIEKLLGMGLIESRGAGRGTYYVLV